MESRPIAVVCALIAVAISGAAAANVTQRVAGKACERARVTAVALSRGAPPAVVTVRATGPSCERARIVVALSTRLHRRLWTEWTYLSLVESGRFPNEPGPEITFEHVIGAVENWVSVEKTVDAPAWPEGAEALPTTSGAEIARYETRLSRKRYLAIRAAGGQMLCTPQGPESAHCLAIDPASGQLVEFFQRGV